MMDLLFDTPLSPKSIMGQCPNGYVGAGINLIAKAIYCPDGSGGNLALK